MDPYRLTRSEWRRVLADEPSYRADQVHAWLVRGVDDPASMTDLPRALRERLAGMFDASPRLLRHTTADGGLTHKVLLATAAGEQIESVLMLYPRRSDARTGTARSARATVCVSTQAGCAMGCPFCATGQAGFRGQLGLGDVVRQVTVLQRMLAAGEIPGAPTDRVTNVVFMGMGEPLANLDTTLAAVRWLTDPDDFGLSPRALTVSTVGLVPGIRRLRDLGLPIRLAVSLHAPTDELRDDLVPVNRQHPLEELLEACRAFAAASNRRLTFEYVLIDGINADALQARQLAALLRERLGRDVPVHVNLIPMNPTPAVPWRAPEQEAQEAFAAILRRAGIPVTVRRNRGGQIDAACGQLYADYALATGRTLPAARDAAQRLLTAAGAPASTPRPRAPEARGPSRRPGGR